MSLGFYNGGIGGQVEDLMDSIVGDSGRTAGDGAAGDAHHVLVSQFAGGIVGEYQSRANEYYLE